MLPQTLLNILKKIFCSLQSFFSLWQNGRLKLSGHAGWTNYSFCLDSSKERILGRRWPASRVHFGLHMAWLFGSLLSRSKVSDFVNAWDMKLGAKRWGTSSHSRSGKGYWWTLNIYKIYSWTLKTRAIFLGERRILIPNFYSQGNFFIYDILTE